MAQELWLSAEYTHPFAARQTNKLKKWGGVCYLVLCSSGFYHPPLRAFLPLGAAYHGLSPGCYILFFFFLSLPVFVSQQRTGTEEPLDRSDIGQKANAWNVATFSFLLRDYDLRDVVYKPNQFIGVKL